jgi:hypothetical protein
VLATKKSHMKCYVFISRTKIKHKSVFMQHFGAFFQQLSNLKTLTICFCCL